MQQPCWYLAEPGTLSGRPTVGALMSLCEGNFDLFARLAPLVREQRGTLVCQGRGGLDLHLIVEEQSPYTSVVRLTHFFPGPATHPIGQVEPAADPPGRRRAGGRADPNLRLRVYHDARQVEVESLRQTALPMRSDYQPPALDAKWKVNCFLEKWLRFCLYEGYRFVPGRCEAPLSEGDDRRFVCI
jgi:uncharacterized protein